MSADDHINKVWQWLDENALVFKTPESITLSGFDVSSGKYSGSFDVTLDNQRIPRRFSFGLGGNGKPEIYFPMFHSPLGAPASYAAVELTRETTEAVKKILASILPAMKPLGLNRETGEQLFLTTCSESARIVDKGTYTAAMTRISAEDFSVSLRMSYAKQQPQIDSPASGESAA